MNKQEINDLMLQAAGDAIEFAKSEFGVELDKTMESIDLIDALLLDCLPLLKDEATRDKNLFTLCNILGAYLGEVFIHYIGGEWFYDESDINAPTTFIEFNGKTFAFPGICYQKLINDPSVSVRKYFELAQGKVMQ
ncbi:hypothetical protein [Algibacillus agarilyticus]|uniref:hypothetical protein n=1 Tax=Algibacillus agarilyticus TaxID=2234133 RepID=UPI000DD00628|nr:hypothetical protein [Algibacillus agarilyticus]